MGIGDKFDELKGKAKGMMGDKENLDKGVDQAAETAKKKTGNKYDDKIDQGTEKAKDGLGKINPNRP